jgi:hypothetical protein
VRVSFQEIVIVGVSTLIVVPSELKHIALMA